MVPFLGARRKRLASREQAAAWLARIDAGASPGDLEGLGEWLGQDTAHLVAFMELASLWDQVEALSQLSEVFPLPEYMAAPDRRQRRAFSAAIAGLAGMTLLGGALMLRPPPEPGSELRRAYQTAIGEQTTIALPDGSSFLLNTNSAVEVAYTPRSRHVFLAAGEGHFGVAPDPDRPFRVFAGKQMVEAVGTAFTVQRGADDQVEVIVTEGTVRFQPLGAAPSPDQRAAFVPGGEAALSLRAGQYASAGSRIGTLQGDLHPEEIEARLSWQHGMLLFQGEPLSHVLEEVGRYTTLRIEAEEDLLDIAVRGYFRVGDIDGLLVAMRENFAIDTTRIAADHILLQARAAR